MKNYNFSLFFVLAISLFSCSKEDNSDAESTFKASNFATTINPDDLVGEWKLSAMTSDSLVDLNNDGSFDKNLLNESLCFNDMNIIFNQATQADGSVKREFSTINGRLDFNGGVTGKEVVCVKNRVDFGTWNVEGTDLILNISIDGTIYTERKVLNYNTTTFAFDVTKAESKAYVTDPGNTSASKITILALEYTRV